MMYKYEKRIEVFLFRIVECCGDISHNESVCDECKILIARCSRLVKRGQIPILYYVELIKTILCASREGNSYDNY
jgi:hypothetical protein